MASISGWTEGILLSVCFLAILAVVTGGFNGMYGKNYQVGLNDTSGAQQKFINYQATAQQQVKGGEATFDATQGISLKSSWGLVKDAVDIAWSFISGGFISQVIASWGLGEAGTLLGLAFRVIFFLSLVASILYALFKVVF